MGRPGKEGRPPAGFLVASQDRLFRGVWGGGLVILTRKRPGSGRPAGENGTGGRKFGDFEAIFGPAAEPVVHARRGLGLFGEGWANRRK